MQQRTTRTFFTALTAIYLSLAVAPALFAALVIILKVNDTLPVHSEGPELTPEMFRYILYALAPAGLAANIFVYRHLLAGIDSGNTLSGKLNQLQGFVLIKTSFLEVPALVGAVGAFTTGDITLLLFTGLMIVAIVYFRPTPDSVCADLQLSENEKSILMTPGAVID